MPMHSSKLKRQFFSYGASAILVLLTLAYGIKTTTESQRPSRSWSFPDRSNITASRGRFPLNIKNYRSPYLFVSDSGNHLPLSCYPDNEYGSTCLDGLAKQIANREVTVTYMPSPDASYKGQRGSSSIPASKFILLSVISGGRIIVSSNSRAESIYALYPPATK
jgi:hypothetical protein